MLFFLKMKKTILLLLTFLNIFSVFGSSIDTVVVTSKSMNKDISMQKFILIDIQYFRY